MPLRDEDIREGSSTWTVQPANSGTTAPNGEPVARGRLGFVPRSVIVQNPSTSPLVITPDDTSGTPLIVPAGSMVCLRWLSKTLNTFSVFATTAVTEQYIVTAFWTNERLQPFVGSL